MFALLSVLQVTVVPMPAFSRISVSRLGEHIQNLEKEQGPDSKAERTIRVQWSDAGPREQIKSSNVVFTSVIKDVYRLVQLQYHADNWSRLPKSLSERLDRFSSDIRPPMENEEFRASIKHATQVYSDSVCAAIRLHISSKQAEIESAAATKDRTDLDHR